MKEVVIDFDNDMILKIVDEFCVKNGKYENDVI